MTTNRADKQWERKKIVLFLKYIATDPFRQLYNWLRETPKRIHNPKAWIYVFTAAMIISLLKKDITGAIICFGMIVLFNLVKDYESGEYMHHYRKKYNDKLFKK